MIVRVQVELFFYAPSYISYDDSSHSEWALDFLLGRSTSGVACFTPS